MYILQQVYLMTMDIFQLLNGKGKSMNKPIRIHKEICPDENHY